MSPQATNKDENVNGSDHDILIRLKENIIYFQDHVVGEIRDVEARSNEKIIKINGELCLLNKKLGECEKDIIRKQGQGDTCCKELDNLQKAFDSYKAEIKTTVDSIKEQHRKDMATAITLSSIIVGLITFLVGKFVV